MRKNQLWAAVVVLLFLFVGSCTTSTDKTDKGIAGENTSGDDAASAFEGDSLTELAVIQSMFAIPIEEDSSINFCGGLKNTTDPQRIRFTIYYSVEGKNPKKQAMFKIKGEDRFQFLFKAPAKGNMYLVMEEEKGLAWKNLNLKEVPPSVEEDECCPNYGVKMLMNRKDVESQGGTGGGGSTKITQN